MSIEIKDLENIDKTEINISDLSSNEIEMIKLNGLINIPLIKGDKGDTGKDGYTPIKGIDYFDGQNGINGEDGKDGTDGQDGYTPIKGKDYFTEEEIQEIKSNILDQVNQFSILVVSKLPTEDIDDHTIYFVPKTKEEQNDVYDEFIYINNGWEHIGTTEVDLSSYYKKDEIDKKLSEVEGNEVYIGKAEEAPSSAKIIVEDEDFGESSTLSKAEVYVGVEEPITGEKVWIRKGKNLFDKSKALLGYWISNEQGDITKADNDVFVTDFIPVFKDVDVYIPATGTARREFYNKNKEGITYLNNSSVQVFTPTEDGFIRVTCVTSTVTMDNLMIYYGSKAAPYEHYIEQKIYVRNKNGVYEELYNREQIDNLIKKTSTGYSEVLYSDSTGVVATSAGNSVILSKSVSNYAAILVVHAKGSCVVNNKLNTQNYGYGINMYWYNEGLAGTFYDNTVYKVVGLCKL